MSSHAQLPDETQKRTEMLPFRLTAWPRLHLGLIDCGTSTPRVFGGSGIGVETEPTVLEVSSDRSFNLEGFEQLDERGQRLVEDAIGRLEGRVPLRAVRIHLARAVPQHVGLGSRTATILGVLKAISLAAGAAISTQDLQVLSGRGGASGVGIHAFFTGGFIVDSGRKRRPGSELLPSGAQLNTTPPPLSVHIQVPESWVFWLMLPAGTQRHGETELEFFRQNTPVPEDEVIETLAGTYHGLVPAMMEGDLQAFASALERLQRTGFKRREIDGQTRQVKDLLADLWGVTSVATGMSSMGPLVFSVCDGQDEVAKARIASLGRGHGVQILAPATAANSGHIVERFKEGA